MCEYKLNLSPVAEVLVVCSDTTAVNSGTGKDGGACSWYPELSKAA